MPPLARLHPLTFLATALFGTLLLMGEILPRLPQASAASTPTTAPAVPAASPGPVASPAPPDTGMVTIESDSQQADNATGIVTATGNVRITYPAKGMVATARQAQYFSKEGKLVLVGDVDVVDSEGQRIRAEKITYRLDSERIVAEPQAGRQVISRLKLRQQSVPAAPPRLP